MRRRDLLAGVGSVGALFGAGAAAYYGLPSVSSLLGEDGDEPRHDPVPVQTVEATGSEAGEVTIPNEADVTFVDLFATDCVPCQEQMPALAAAHDRFGDDVFFVSITNQSEEMVSDEALADWWDEYDADWTVGRDSSADLIAHYGMGTPIGIVFDSDGRVRWEEQGRKTEAEIAEQLEDVLADEPDA